MKGKSTNMFVMLIMWCKIPKKNYCKLQLHCENELDAYSHPVKNVWISSLTLNLIF